MAFVLLPPSFLTLLTHVYPTFSLAHINNSMSFAAACFFGFLVLRGHPLGILFFEGGSLDLCRIYQY